MMINLVNSKDEAVNTPNVFSLDSFLDLVYY